MIELQAQELKAVWQALLAQRRRSDLHESLLLFIETKCKQQGMKPSHVAAQEMHGCNVQHW